MEKGIDYAKRLSDRVVESIKEGLLLGGMFEGKYIDKLTIDIQNALHDEYKTYKEQRIAEIKKTRVYLLTGEDVETALINLDREELAENIEIFSKIVDHANTKLELPWSEYLEAVVDQYIVSMGF